MKVLVVAPHMDDETFGMGGTIARHVAARDEVHVCIVCKRAYDHKFTPELVERERSAAMQAIALLGCGSPTFLDLRDELLDERLLDVIVPLEDCVGRIRPEVVYTVHRGDTNQDHRAVFDASVVACRSVAKHRVRRFLCYEVLSSTEQAPPFPERAFLPNLFVDIAPFVDLKVDAARAYETELRQSPHPRSPEGIRTLARYRGMQVGLNAAEAFVVVRDVWL